MSNRAPRRTDHDLAGLLEACAEGDEQAFAALYDATVASACALALRVLRDPHLAEEVIQDAYLEVWRQSQRFDRRRGGARGWVLTLVHRRAVDRVRAAEAAARRDAAYQRRALAGTEVDTTSATALATLEARRVRAALAVLAPQQRRAVSLAYFGGLSHAEVAAVVGAPLGTVKWRIREGLQKLRRALEPQVA